MNLVPVLSPSLLSWERAPVTGCPFIHTPLRRDFLRIKQIRIQLNAISVYKIDTALLKVFPSSKKL